MNDAPTEGEVKAYYEGLREGLRQASWKWQGIEWIGRFSFSPGEMEKLRDHVKRVNAEEYGKLQLVRR